MMPSTNSFLFLLLAVAQHTCLAIYELRQTLTADDTTRLGRSVAFEIESGFMALGSTSNSVRIYRYDEHDDRWEPYQELSSESVTNDGFGWSVAMDGQYLAVGAPSATHPGGNVTGAVSIYRRSIRNHKWELTQTLYGDTVFGQQFGHAVAMNDQNLIISDRRHNEPALSAGRASVFRRERRSRTFNIQNHIVANDAAAGDLFGYSVSIHGDYAAVRATGDSDGASLTGAVYVFQKMGSSWEFLIKLVAPVPEALKNYGESVSVYDNSIAVGALRHGGTKDDEGAVYVYDRVGGSFTLTVELLAPNPSTGDQLGRSVAKRGQTVVAGAWKDDVGVELDVGSAYVFLKQNSVWAFKEQLFVDPPVPEDQYGGAVALGCDGTLLVGGPFRFGEKGAVSVYQDNRVTAFQGWWRCKRLRLRRRDD